MRTRTAFRITGAGLLLGGAALGYASLVERNLFTLRRFDVPVLAPDAEPLRVLHISDLHLTPDQRRKQDWVAALAATDPDLVITTGDNLAHPDAVPAVLRALGPLLELPGAFVFGSNDYRGPVLKNPFGYFARDRPYRQGVELPTEKLRGVLARAGWLDLNNARTLLKAGGRTVELVGVDDPHIARDDYASVTGPASESADVHLGLTHSPEPEILHRMAADGFSRCWPATRTAARSGYPASVPWSPTVDWTGGWPGACTAGPARPPGYTCPPAWVPTRPPRYGSPAGPRRRC